MLELGMDPIISTLSAAATGNLTPNGFNLLDEPFVQAYVIPFLKYFASPLTAVGFFYWLLRKTFNLGELNQKITVAIQDIADLKKDGKKLLSHVDIIRTHLVTSGGLDANLFGPGSPLKLLAAGLKLLKDSGFEKIYKDNKEWFIKEIKKHNVETMSDIDEASLRVLEQCRDKRIHADFKEIAFQNGVPFDVLMRVLAIYLRDEVLKEIKIKKVTSLPKPGQLAKAKR